MEKLQGTTAPLTLSETRMEEENFSKTNDEDAASISKVQAHYDISSSVVLFKNHQNLNSSYPRPQQSNLKLYFWMSEYLFEVCVHVTSIIC